MRNMQLIPTQAGIKAMEAQGLGWPQLIALMQTADREQPDPKSRDPKRRQHLSGEYTILTAHGVWEGEPALYLLGMKKNRVHEPAENSDLYADAVHKKGSKKGGVGSLLPTSVDEVLARIDATEGWSWQMGGKHYAVHGPNGERATIPVTASDWRSLANNVSQLRQVGLDVRRPAPGKATA